MRIHENTDADVRILPRSKTLLYSEDQYRQTPGLQTNLQYIEERLINDYLQFGTYNIVPNGYDNNFPENFRQLLDSVYIGHGVKRTLLNLLISGGTGLYTEIKEEKKIIRDWQLDNEITDWLESFNFNESYLLEAATDMVYVENFTTLYQRNRAARIGQTPRIAALAHMPATNMRLEKRDANGRINNIYYSDWTYANLQTDDIQPYPMFNPETPYRHPVSAEFVKMPTFGSMYYGRPVDIGATTMLKVLSILPNFHNANLTEKGFKWIVAVSKEYYQSIISSNKWGTDKNPEFIKWKEAFTAKIDAFLTAPEGDKVQTRFMTEFAIDQTTRTMVDAIKITKLDDDTKTLSEVGMELNDTFSLAYVSSNSINPLLANLHLKNHALSGSTLREAYEMHINVSAPNMRALLLKPVNRAIKLNFPAKNLKLGFMDLAFSEYNNKQTTKKTETV